MTIRRCAPNLVSGDLGASRGFYAGLLGFEVAMDEDDLTMYRSPSNPTAQVTVGTDAESAWGVRRFFVEDPDGTVVNVLSHL